MDQIVVNVIMHFCFLIKYTFMVNASACASYSADIESTSLKNQVISGHVLKNVTGADFGECFWQCSRTCHCRSFNLELEGSGVCELNDVDKEEAPRALRVRHGFVHVSFRALTESSDSSMADVCCVENPCKNGGVCIPDVRFGKRSFSCQCSSGFIGKLCDLPAISCQNYMQANQSAVSGLYTIKLRELPMPKTVYCYFDRVNMEAWTLIMSYQFSYRGNMVPLPFHRDNPINERSPSFDYYRASLAVMKYLRNESSFWRATCNHDTKPRVDDNMQSYFTTLDIMTYSGRGCATLDHIKLYGTSYSQVTTWVVQDQTVLFFISPEDGKSKCKFPSALKVPYADGGLFGWFYHDVPQHGCAEFSTSTTQYWFGVKL